MITISQQKELMKWVANGHTSLSIGNIMGVSHKTIELRISEMKKEYNAVNMANLVHIFHQRKLIK